MLLLAVIPALALAQPMGRDINPGVLGPNALPTLAGDAPWVRDELQLELGWAGQLSTPAGGGVDASMLVPFRVEVGLFRRVAFWADGSPFELWQYSAETNAAWSPRRSKGITRADVRLGTKVQVFEQQGWLPAAAVRVVLKTATGEDLFTRRFLDAPAYQFDLLTAWKVLLGVTRLEARAAIGFLAWQQGFIGQNDAVTWNVGAFARWPLAFLGLEARGFSGWVRDDKPVTVALQAGVTLTPAVEVLVGAARTFVDPPALDVRAAVRVRLPTTTGVD